MRYLTHSKYVAAVLILLSLPGFASAQMSATSSVTANGTAVVKRPASALRMSVQLTGKAKTLKEALAKLKDRREAALLQIEQFGADKDSIKSSDLKLGGAQTEQQKQIERMFMQQRRARGRASKALNLPKYITVSQNLTATFLLEYKNTEELLITSQELQDKILEADLAGLNEPKQLTPEEEELAEEMAAMMNEYGGYNEEEVKPGVPQFLYVATISEKDHQAALASAFGQAQKKASRLAAAAGAELGALAQIQSELAGMAQDYNYSRQMYMMQMMMAQQSGDDAEASDGQSFAQDPGMVTFRFMVNASFRLK